MEVVAVGFADGEFFLAGAEVELVTVDLADGAEVDDVGTVDADEMRGEEGGKFLEGEETEDGFGFLEGEGSVVALCFDEEEVGEVDAVNGGAVFEEEGIGVAGGVAGGAVFEFEDGFGEAGEVEGFDEVVDDVELVAFGAEVGTGADDDDSGVSGEGF